MAGYQFTIVNDPDGTITSAIDVNDSGQVVGFYDVLDNNNVTIHAFSETGGKYSTISGPLGSANSFAFGLNNEGEIVGSYNASPTSSSGYLYNNGNYQIIQISGAQSTYASGINNNGEIVGDYSDASFNDSGFIDKNNVITTFSAPSARSTTVNGLNDEGAVVGLYQAQDNSVHGFVFENGVAKTVDIAGASLTEIGGINDVGTIAGDYEDSNGVMHGFTEDAAGTVTEIDFDPGAGSTYIRGINNAGQVSGSFVSTDFQTSTSFVGTPLCFVSGSLILTTRGNVAVEHLVVGDLVVTASGAVRVIRWLGKRSIGCQSANTLPVRISAGAFGENLPQRDLYLSPGHPVLVNSDNGKGGHLVPIMCLINGTTVDRVETDQVTYWHVELDEHDILLAEGLPAESYIDLGSRAWFGGSENVLFDPDLLLAGIAGRCRPVAVDGPVVESERRRLDAVFVGSLVAACAWPGGADATFFHCYRDGQRTGFF